MRSAMTPARAMIALVAAFACAPRSRSLKIPRRPIRSWSFNASSALAWATSRSAPLVRG